VGLNGFNKELARDTGIEPTLKWARAQIPATFLQHLLRDFWFSELTMPFLCFD